MSHLSHKKATFVLMIIIVKTRYNYEDHVIISTEIQFFAYHLMVYMTQSHVFLCH